MTAIFVLLAVAASMALLAGLVLLVEAVAAGTSGAAAAPERGTPKRDGAVVVIVPAHDEEEGIAATVSGILRQFRAGDRLLVVADNCSDATAARARAAGADVAERHDVSRRGKGYALDFGLRQLGDRPPRVVLFVDADCRLGPGTIDALAATVERTNRPAQALNLMRAPAGANPKLRVAAFAWVFKNCVRPFGLAALGLPCQLMGTGMAIPAEALRCIRLDTADIVEDVKMGLNLADQGFAPVFCPSASVDSDFPSTDRGFAVQRHRWESGSLRVAFRTAPAMLARGLWTMNWPLVAMAGDLMVPPVMMLATALVVGLFASSLFWLAGGGLVPLGMFAISGGLLLAALAIAWARFGRDTLTLGDMAHLPGIAIKKIVFYVAMLRGRGVGWIRTDRK